MLFSSRNLGQQMVTVVFPPDPLSALRWLLNAFDLNHDPSLSEAKRLITESYDGHQERWGARRMDTMVGACG